MTRQLEERWDHKKHVLSRYDAGSHAYDELYREEQLKKYQRCLAHLRTGINRLVLDCGCGTGMLLELLSDHGNLLVGVDCSHAMLTLARSKVGSSPAVGLICADADNLPFKPEAFDLVVSFTMLGNLPSHATTVIEIARVAKNKAQVILSFVKKNLQPEDVARSMKAASLMPEELIDDNGLRDWIVIGEKAGETRALQRDWTVFLKSLL